MYLNIFFFVFSKPKYYLVQELLLILDKEDLSVFFYMSEIIGPIVLKLNLQKNLIKKLVLIDFIILDHHSVSANK